MYKQQQRDTLLPNEVRVSSKSTPNFIINQVTTVLKTHRYSNCKVVGRGRAACEITQDVILQLKKILFNQYSLDIRTASALNRNGEVVDELHVMIIERNSQPQQRPFVREEQ